MADTDFAGSIPAVYDRHLVPLMFGPYAADLAQRVAGRPVGRVLEIAAGTGVVTAAVAAAVPEHCAIVATDLNEAMLEVGRRRISSPKVTWQTADAAALPFPDAGFDMLLCQFGIMFVPDKAGAYAEMRRVLRPGGRMILTAWDRIEANPIPHAVEQALTDRFPDDPPRFMSRIPHGYHDAGVILAGLAEAGFGTVAVETVTLPSPAPSAHAVAEGFCRGTPLRHEITARDPGGLAPATGAVARAVTERFGAGPFSAPMQALTITAG